MTLLALDIQFDAAKAEAALQGLFPSVEQLQRARARALRKAGKHMSVEIKRSAAKKLRVPQKSIADRFYLSKVDQNSDAVNLWIGAWGISPYSLATPVQTETGVMVPASPGRSYPGAFLAAIYSGKEQIWIRKKSKHYSPALYPVVGKKHAGSVPSELRHRFPVVRAAIPFDDAVLASMHRDVLKGIEEFFQKTLLAEINYEVAVKGAK